MRNWKKGVIAGGIWGILAPIFYWVLIDFKVFWIKTPMDVLQIITLPLYIYSKIFIPQTSPRGSFYYSPIIAFPFSIVIGALIGLIIGFGVEKYKSRRTSK